MVSNAIKATGIAFLVFYLSLMSPFLTLALLFSIPVGYYVSKNNINIDEIVPNDILQGVQSMLSFGIKLITSLLKRNEQSNRRNDTDETIEAENTTANSQDNSTINEGFSADMSLSSLSSPYVIKRHVDPIQIP